MQVRLWKLDLLRCAMLDRCPFWRWICGIRSMKDIYPGLAIVASGPGISITGGHGDLNNFAPQTRVDDVSGGTRLFYRRWSGPDSAYDPRAGEVWGGCDQDSCDRWSAFARGQAWSSAVHVGRIEEWQRRLRIWAGRKIAAHAHGAEGIKNAILAGIDSIEHASLVDDEGIRLAKGAWDIFCDGYL